MNNLNSILMEGKLTEDAKLIDNVTYFTIESVRYYKEDDETLRETSTFNIKMKGKFFSTLEADRNVRCVGRLKQTDNGVIIICEHIEIK